MPGLRIRLDTFDVDLMRLDPLNSLRINFAGCPSDVFEDDGIPDNEVRFYSRITGELIAVVRIDVQKQG